MLYARLTRWFGIPHVERRVALLAFVCALPSLALGMHADDFVLRYNVLERGPFAAYEFFSRDAELAHAEVIEQRTNGRMPWWVDEHPHTAFFRPLSSVSLWLDFAHAAPSWWMHLENCAIFAVTVWLAVMLYKQLGLSEAGLVWAAVFFGLDGAIATPVGWIAGRNTLLAACFGLACMLFHDRALRAGRPALLALSSLCFALALLSAELGLCALGYLIAYTLTLDRAAPTRRVLALLPYGLVLGVYLTNYVMAGYGVRGGAVYRDVTSPFVVLFSWLESIPVWLATTATVPIASFLMLSPGLRVPILAFSVVVLAVIVPLLGSRWLQEPTRRMLALGAVLSLVPLAAVSPQERLRFLLSFGVYGLLGPWVARDFDAPQRARRWVSRFVWRLHGLWLPLAFVPLMFSIASAQFAGGGAGALDRALPRAKAPITILLNPPSWTVAWFQGLMRFGQGDVEPPVYELYAGGQPLEIQRVDERSLELHVARGWMVTPFEKNMRDVTHTPYRTGDRLELPHFQVEVREATSAGMPLRVRFTFERSLDDPGLAFRTWVGKEVSSWQPPPVGSQVQLAAPEIF